MKLERRKICLSAFLALALTFMQLIGYQISMKYGTAFPGIIFRHLDLLSTWQCVVVGVVVWCIWTMLVYGFFSFLDRRANVIFEGSGFMERQIFWVLFGVLMLLSWFLSLLGCYPGFYNYDIGGQVPQVMYDTVPYHTHHSLLHTLIAGGLITFGYRISGGSMVFGVFLHSIVQMSACAVCFTYSVYTVWKITRRRWLVIFAFCYYSFFPTVVMFTMSTTKDVFCALSLLLTGIQLYWMYKDPEVFWKSKSRVAIVATCMLLSCLFRKNVVFGVILFFFFNVFLYRQERKRVTIMLAGVIMAYFVSNWGLAAILHAESGSIAEAFSAPLQQVARVYHENGEEAFTPEEMKLIDAVISRSDLAGYNCFQADSIKNHSDFEVIKNDKRSYLGLWLRKGSQYPGCYIKAFLDNTYQAWYPWTSVVDDPASGHIYYFDYEGWETVEIQPLIIGIYEFYRKISSEVFYQKYPVFRLFFSIGSMLWVVLLAWGYGIWNKKKQVTWPLLFVLCVCGTALLGPVSLVRYYLILFYAFPVCVAFFGEKGAS